MQNRSTESSPQIANSSYHPIHSTKRLSPQSNSHQQNRSSINSAPPEGHKLPRYNVLSALPQPQTGHGRQNFDPYSIYNQSPVAASLPVFTYPVDTMNVTINQPYQTHFVTGPDLLFGLQPSGYSQPRQLVYPYNIIPNPFQRNIFPTRTTRQYTPPLSQPSQYVHPTQSPFNSPIFYSPYGSSASFTQYTQPIDLHPLNRKRQQSYGPRAFPQQPPNNFSSGALISRGPPRKPKQSGFALWVGNLPGNVQIRELKDFFGMDELESILLIAKSNCAFVNYKTEASRDKALSLFNNKG